jgi:2-succinyl-5-enolpyruvyl-6-hydroxy-3-cyclohexene-1-carboxylate synthase
MNNNGGKIFKSLEQGDARFDGVFDKVYGTPHNKDLAAIATSAGLTSVNVQSLEDLTRALENHTNVIVVDLTL